MRTPTAEGERSKWLRRVGALAVLSGTLALGACRPSGNTAAPSTSGGATPESSAGHVASAPNSGGAPADASAPSAAAAAFAQPRKATGPVKIQLITNNSSSFWTAMAKGMNDEAPQLPDCTAGWQSPRGATPTNNDQKTAFDTVMAGNADGIGLSVIDPAAFTPVIDSAIDKGVPVICFDSDAPKSKRLAYIGTNNYEAGKKAGEEAIKLLPNGGNVVAFVGSMSPDNARERWNGFMDAVRGHNITPLQDPYQDNADKTGAAYRNVQDAITKYGDKINLLVGIWSYNGPAIIDVVQRQGIRNKVKIIAFDGDPKTLTALQTGGVDAAILQKPYDFGRLSTMLLYYINRKGLDAAFQELQPELDKAGMKRNGSVIDTGVEVITPGPSATDFIKRLKEKGLETT